MIAYIDYPSWITPEVFGFLRLPEGNFLNIIRWYGLMYIVGIVISYFQSMYILKKDNLPSLNKQIIEDYYFWAVLGLILGGRVFSCLVYNFDYFSQHPLEIIIPIRFSDMKFVGFEGMAFHGAVIGVFTASVIFTRVKKINFRELCDLVFPVIPLGYTFGRIANFINGELWGRITASPFGILFPYADKSPINLSGVKDVISKLGWKVDQTANMVIDASGRQISNLIGFVTDQYGRQTDIIGINLPRHPSQLYEAFFEGIVLFLIIWFAARKFKPFKGFLASVYLIGYSIARLSIEFFREPDSQFANIEQGKYTGFIFSTITMGQFLSILMILAGILIGLYFYKLSLDDEKKPKINLQKHKKKKK